MTGATTAVEGFDAGAAGADATAAVGVAVAVGTIPLFVCDDGNTLTWFVELALGGVVAVVVVVAFLVGLVWATINLGLFMGGTNLGATAAA